MASLQIIVHHLAEAEGEVAEDVGGRDHLQHRQLRHGGEGVRVERESRRAASPKHSCWRKRLRSNGDGLADVVVHVARTEFSVAKRQNRARSAASIHRNNTLGFMSVPSPTTDG